jgi:hypothetical protein
MLDDLIPGLMMILITSSLDLICQSETIFMHTILFWKRGSQQVYNWDLNSPDSSSPLPDSEQAYVRSIENRKLQPKCIFSSFQPKHHQVLFILRTARHLTDAGFTHAHHCLKSKESHALVF